MSPPKDYGFWDRATDDYDEYDWWNPFDWFGNHDEIRNNPDPKEDPRYFERYEKTERQARKTGDLDLIDQVEKERNRYTSEKNKRDLKRKRDSERAKVEQDRSISEAEKNKLISEIDVDYQAGVDQQNKNTYTSDKVAEFKSKFPQYAPMIRIQQKALRGGELSAQEAKILRMARQDLAVDLKSKDFVDNVLGMFTGDTGAQQEFISFLNDSPKFKIRAEDGSYIYDTPMTIEEQAIADTDKTYEDYIKRLDKTEDEYDEANEIVEEGYEEALDEERELKQQSRNISEFYNKRLGTSDKLLDRGIEQAEEYANSPSLAEETVRKTVDDQLQNDALALQSGNIRFGSGANLERLQRDKSERNKRVAQQSALLAMQEQQEKKKYLASALAAGATDKLNLANLSGKRENFQNEASASRHADQQRSIQAGTKLNAAGRKDDQAKVRFALENARQNIGTDNYENFLNRADRAEESAKGRNYALASGLINTAGRLGVAAYTGGVSEVAKGAASSLASVGKSPKNAGDAKLEEKYKNLA